MNGRINRTGRGKVERGQTPFFMQYADDIVAHGYNVVAVLPGTKKPRYHRWQGACYKNTDLDWLPKHSHRCPNDSVGIACGSRVVAIDIDAEDAALADKLHQIARETLGDTPLVRFGNTPKRVLLYRPLDNIQTLRAGKFEVISYGGQVLAFGIHPKTGQPYSWVGGDPSNTPLERLPQVGAADIELFVRRASDQVGRDVRTCPERTRSNPHSRQPARLHNHSSQGTLADRIVRNDDGIVIDGREALLTRIVALEYAKGCQTPDELAQRAWMAFQAEADIARPKGHDHRRRWSFWDAFAKARAICRKAPKLQAPRSRKGYHPVRNLHGHCRPGYWSSEQKERHQTEAKRRTTTPSVLVINRAMLDGVSLQTGMCIASVDELDERTGFAARTIKAARRELLNLGLWFTGNGNGVYVPHPFERPRRDLPLERKEKRTARVQVKYQHPLYRSVVS